MNFVMGIGNPNSNRYLNLCNNINENLILTKAKQI